MTKTCFKSRFVVLVKFFGTGRLITIVLWQIEEPPLHSILPSWQGWFTVPYYQRKDTGVCKKCSMQNHRCEAYEWKHGYWMRRQQTTSFSVKFHPSGWTFNCILRNVQHAGNHHEVPLLPQKTMKSKQQKDRMCRQATIVPLTLHLELGPPPVTPLLVVSLLAVGLESDPVRNRPVLLHLLSVLQLLLECLDGTHPSEVWKRKEGRKKRSNKDWRKSRITMHMRRAVSVFGRCDGNFFIGQKKPYQVQISEWIEELRCSEPKIHWDLSERF